MRKDDLLFAFALGYYAFNLIQTAVRTWRTMFNDIAPHFARATTLAGLGSSPLDALRWAHAIGFQAGIGSCPLRWLGVDFSGVRGRG